MKSFDHPGAAAAVCLASSLAFCGSVFGQTCSGGPDGGIDATGNLCNAVADVSAQARAQAIAAPSATGADAIRPAVARERQRGNAVTVERAPSSQPVPLVDPPASIGSDPSQWTGAHASPPTPVPLPAGATRA